MSMYHSQMISSLLFAKTSTTAFLKWRGKDCPEKKSDGDATSKFQRNFMNATWIYCANTRTLSASTSKTWGSQRISSTKFTSKRRILSTVNNSKFQRTTTNSLNKHWTNGWNWGLLRDQTHFITHPFSVFQRNWAKDFALCRICGSLPELPHWQILDKGDHRVHRSHRTGQLNHFHYLGPNFRFLADATGWGLPETDSFHNFG